MVRVLWYVCCGIYVVIHMLRYIYCGIYVVYTRTTGALLVCNRVCSLCVEGHSFQQLILSVSYWVHLLLIRVCCWRELCAWVCCCDMILGNVICATDTNTVLCQGVLLGCVVCLGVLL